MNQAHSLLLARLVERLPGTGVHLRETSLALSEDGDSLLLRRYWEHCTAEDRAIWLERCHRIPVERLVRWMICQGEPNNGPAQALRVMNGIHRAAPTLF